MEYYKNLDLQDIVYFCEFDLVWKTEIFRDIPDYKGLYQVSDLGRVKSLRNDKKRKEKILKQGLNNLGYKHVRLCDDGKCTTIKIHILVPICFLNHVPCGYKLVVNHKNFIRWDNRLLNLEIVTQRENSNKKHLYSISKYTGVYWNKDRNKWNAQITINNKKKHLGYFINEIDAHLAYEKALKEIIV